MTSIGNGTAAGGADRFDTVEALLTRYPEVTPDEVDTLKHWFRKEASAFDVASMAAKDPVAPGYRRFRADHVDRISGADMIKGAIFALVVVGLLLAVVLPRF